MPAYSSSALGDLIGRILDNAIRRYMSEHEWYGTADTGFRGNGWEGELPATFRTSTGKVRLKLNSAINTVKSPPPPGASYVGDQTVGTTLYQVYEVDAAEVIYSPWVDRIQEAFEGWWTLPDPDDFDAPRNNLEDAVDELTPEKQGDSGFTFVNVEVSNAIGLMHKWISPQSGNSSDLLYAFDSAYGVDRITGVMTNQAQVAAGLGLAVAGEQMVWTKARTDIMRIASEAAEAFDVSAGGGASINLKVVKSFVDLVGVFVPKQFAVLKSAVSAGIGFLDTITPEPTSENKEVSIKGSTAEEMLGDLERAIKDLERAIADEESEIRSKLKVLQGILGDRAASDFHLHPDRGLDDGFVDAAAIRINTATVQSIGRNDVPVVAAAFLRAAEKAAARTGSGIWSRENGIGIGPVGPYNTWQATLEDFDAITTGSARELIKAGQLLAEAAGWIEGADDDSAQTLAGLRDELSRGETGWSA